MHHRSANMWETVRDNDSHNRQLIGNHVRAHRPRHM